MKGPNDGVHVSGGDERGKTGEEGKKGRSGSWGKMFQGIRYVNSRRVVQTRGNLLRGKRGQERAGNQKENFEPEVCNQSLGGGSLWERG